MRVYHLIIHVLGNAKVLPQQGICTMSILKKNLNVPLSLKITSNPTSNMSPRVLFPGGDPSEAKKKRKKKRGSRRDGRRRAKGAHNTAAFKLGVFPPAAGWSLEYWQKHEGQDLYPEWKPNKDTWVPVTEGWVQFFRLALCSSFRIFLSRIPSQIYHGIPISRWIL